MQIATNCTGSFLLSKLLMSRMEETAAMPGVGRDEVRCTWPGSIGVDVLSPRGGGMTLENDGRPKVLGPKPDYGQSKVGNLFLAKEFARRGKGSTKVVHACFNPGNLKTELQRHSPSIQAAIVVSFIFLLHYIVGRNYRGILRGSLDGGPEKLLHAWLVGFFHVSISRLLLYVSIVDLISSESRNISSHLRRLHRAIFSLLTGSHDGA